MITIRKEPEGLLLTRADIVAWCGLTNGQWKKLRPHLRPVTLPCAIKPFYRKSEIKTKLVQTIVSQ
jgi:hypothetical protein